MLQVSTSRRAIQLRVCIVCIVLECVAFFPCRCSRCSHAWCCRPWSGSQCCRMRGQRSPGTGQLGQNPARPMAMPVAMPVAMPTPIVKAVVKPVVKPSQWIYALLQSTPGRSTRWSSVEGVVLACRVAPTCDSNQTRNV